MILSWQNTKRCQPLADGKYKERAMDDEILKQLLSNELLSEETKAEISEKWTSSVKTFKKQIREEVEAEVRVELSEQWIAERDELIAKVDGFVSEALVAEIEELKSDIKAFRDLEAEHDDKIADLEVQQAEQIVEQKHALAEEVASELDELVEKMDAFFEVRLRAELEELQEDLQLVKENEFGRRIYEAFAGTFAKVHQDDDTVAAKLAIAESKLADVEERLQEAEEARNLVLRESKLDKILAPLSGQKREQMAMVLKNIETSKLEESYKYFIRKILKEDVPETTSLNEDKSDKQKTTVVTGDDPVEHAVKKLDESQVRLQRLAGITK
jgi:hypothetical protein